MFKRDFHLGSCVVRPALNRVERDGQTLRLRPKSMDVLAFLAERPGQVASRDEVLAAVWADSNVAEEGLTRCIAEIRQALDDDVHRPAYVETVPKRGYRLIVPVEQVADPKLALPPDRPGLLVMPFDNLSQERQDGYLADGLTEEIISKVSRLTALRVISRTSTMSLKGTDKDVRALARQLDVQYVVEGSVRKSGRRLRISAQLIDAASDTHLWAGQYSGTLDAVFEVQEGVSRAVAKALRLSLSADRQGGRVAQTNSGLAAYDCHLRARGASNRFTADGATEAIDLLEHSLAALGDHAILYAGLGYAYFKRANVGPPRDGDYAQAARHAATAKRMDPGSAQAHLVLGLVHSAWHGDQIESIRCLRRALAIDPAEPDALWWLTIILGHFMGRMRDAWPLADQLSRIDPLNPLAQAIGGTLFFCEGRYDRAVDTFQRAFPEPALPIQRAWLGVGLAYAGRTDEALAVIAPVESMPASDYWSSLCVLLTYALRGEAGRARRVFTPEFVSLARSGQHYSWQVASLCARLGWKDDALDWLLTAVDRGYLNYAHLHDHDPFLATLRGEPRFKRLMSRVKRASDAIIV